jgi:hypothetical protein
MQEKILRVAVLQFDRVTPQQGLGFGRIIGFLLDLI